MEFSVLLFTRQKDKRGRFIWTIAYLLDVISTDRDSDINYTIIRASNLAREQRRHRASNHKLYYKCLLSYTSKKNEAQFHVSENFFDYRVDLKITHTCRQIHICIILLVLYYHDLYMKN